MKFFAYVSPKHESSFLSSAFLHTNQINILQPVLIRMSTKPVSIIVATLLPSFGIGHNNQLPWRLSNELKYFKKVTVGDDSHSNAVIMGRKTWESIPPRFRPLPSRLNVVITRNKEAKSEGSELVFHSVPEALAALQQNDAVKRIFIIGGSQIYKETLPFVDHLLITEIRTCKDIAIDTYFDKEYVHQHFQKSNKTELEKHIGFETETDHTENDFEYQYTLYERK